MNNLKYTQEQRKHNMIVGIVAIIAAIIVLIMIAAMVSSLNGRQESVVKPAVAAVAQIEGIEEVPSSPEGNTVVRCYGNMRYFVEDVVEWKFENNLWTFKNKSGRISHTNMPCYFEDIPEMKEGR